ncbi:unnamed protein product [Periconia digitata]|uniref:Polyketide synthase n=1 Tax=Periconia digitata TaxID=1303443 RepID=A0A9W4UBN3_9PLEO|nr:unnamed protein product [Periconia digitata]
MPTMTQDVPIAVIGLSYRAPGVGRKNLYEFLATAQSAWSRVPAERFTQDAFYHPDHHKTGTISSKGGHFLSEDIYAFDAPFFKLRPEEVRAIDPQHRMILECAFEAAENAGVTLEDLAGSRTGVFAAIGSNEYAVQSVEDIYTTTKWTALGTSNCMFSNRLSYFLDLKGPSISMEAACASSSYAFHVACQSLRIGECESAFVSASSLILGNSQWNCLDKLGALSNEGKSFSYDTKAEGYGRGEGAATFLIKRLDLAVRDGDPIQAIVRNSAASHNGRSDGITMPSGPAQENLLRRVHEEIGLRPSDTPVIEGHGTGTQAGDPVEATAFANVLGAERTPSNPLYLGSLKSNFGHLEGASGALGIVKAILMLQHDEILPTANFEQFNERIKGQDKLVIPTKPMPWPRDEARRVIMTNFGFGGANAAILLEAAASSSQLLPGSIYHPIGNGFHAKGDENKSNSLLIAKSSSTSRLYVLSAKSEQSLRAYVSSFQQYLEKSTKDEFQTVASDLCYTLSQRRTHHMYRIATPADSIQTLIQSLRTAKISKIKKLSISFIFTGQGAQSARMSEGLHQYEKFRDVLDQAEKQLHDMGASWSLKEELMKTNETSRLNEAEISQPACTVVQIGLIEILRSWGIAPSNVTGHSSGEIAAAYTAGFLNLRAAVAVAYFRGQAAARLLNDQGNKGAMMALGAGPDVANRLIKNLRSRYATIAAVNSPQSVTISGDSQAIDDIESMANAEGLFNRRLKVDVAYHSKHMSNVAPWYLEAIQPFFKWQENPSEEASPTFVSSVTGQIESSETVNANYWIENLVRPVQFADAIKRLVHVHGESTDAKTVNLMVEVGPHSALQGPIKQTLTSLRQDTVDPISGSDMYLPTLIRNTPGDEALQSLAGALFSSGAQIDMAQIHKSTQSKPTVLTDLPSYNWDKSTTYKYRSRVSNEKLHPKLPIASVLGNESVYAIGGERMFRHVFTLDDIPWLPDHDIAGMVIFPMTGYLSMATDAVRRVWSGLSKPGSISVSEFHLKRSLEVQQEEQVDITTKLSPAATGTATFSSTLWNFEISSWSEEYGWTNHCHGQVEALSSDLSLASPTFSLAEPLLERMKGIATEGEEAYGHLAQLGTRYGPSFKGMQQCWIGPDWTIMEMELREIETPVNLSDFGSLVAVDPPTLDSHLHGSLLLAMEAAYIPTFVAKVRISNNIPEASKQRIIVATRLLNYDKKWGRLETQIAVFAESSTKQLIPIVEWESISSRAINPADTEGQVKSLPTGFRWELSPAVELLENDVTEAAVNDGSTELVEKAGYNVQASLVICGSFLDDDETEFAHMVGDILAQQFGQETEILPIAEVEIDDQSLYVFIDSPQQSILKDLSHDRFTTIQDFLLNAKGVLWIASAAAGPEAEMIIGMMRTLRQELDNRNLMVLSRASQTEEATVAISQLAQRLYDPALADSTKIKDQDFIWQNERLHVPRWSQIEGVRETFAAEAEIPVQSQRNIWESGNAIELTIGAAGNLDSLYFRKTETKSAALGDGEILVKAEAVGMNFRDLLIFLGSIPWCRPGFEGSGIVMETGRDVTHLQPGDRVFYVSMEGGSYSTYTRMPSWRACKTPASMSSTEAASLIIAYSTAIFAINRVGRVRKGESVLIHAASGAVGQACIVLAQHAGARVFATAGTPEKRQFLHDTFGISKSDIYSSRNNDFRDEIINATEGRGVDVIVNSLSGALLQDTWALIAEFGRFVEIGKKDFLQNSSLGMRPFDRNVTFSGIDLRAMFIRRPEEERECLSEIMDLIRSGVVRPIQPISVYPVTELSTGLRKLQSGHNIGKIVITFGDNDTALVDSSVPLCPDRLPSLLKPDVTYLITGGTGGIGRSLATWMFSNGAHNVVLLGRSAATNRDVQKLRAQYEDSDKTLRGVACDVSSREQLNGALAEIADLPPVGGVVHGALFLRDCLFGKNTYEDWQNISNPKLQGAWNLHHALGSLDFFISLSSLVGVVGNAGQVIYSGTSTFLESFSRSRNGQGMHAVCVALPAVMEIGSAAKAGLAERLWQTSGAALTEQDVQTVVKAAILGSQSGWVHDGQAVLFRLAPGEEIASPTGTRLHPLTIAGRLRTQQLQVDDGAAANGGAERGGKRQLTTEESLLEALMGKVSSITMIPLDEVGPEEPLASYNLDSLVSVELRNWIRREAGVEMALPSIVGAANLRALSARIWGMMGKSA